MNDDELESLLRRGHVADDGFTAKVVQHLPAPRKRVPRIAILLGATSAASLVAFVTAPHALTSLIEGVESANALGPAIALAAIVAVLVGGAAQEAAGGGDLI